MFVLNLESNLMGEERIAREIIVSFILLLWEPGTRKSSANLVLSLISPPSWLLRRRRAHA